MYFFPQWISDIGFIITALAFGITIWQIYKLGKTTSQIQKEVIATQSKIQKAFAISDLSKSCQTISNIHSYLKERNFELAHSKIIEINDTIIEIKEIPALKNFEGLKKLEDYSKYLSSDLKRLQNTIFVEHSEIGNETLRTVLSNLQEISNILSRIKAQLKHQSNE